MSTDASQQGFGPDGIYRAGPVDYDIHLEKPGGCLPRKSKVGEICPLFEDSGVPLVDPKDWSKYTGKISLRPWVRDILDQNGVGSCAAESSTQAVMTSRVAAGMDQVLLNPWFVYRVTSGGSDRGSNIDDNLAFIRENGVAPMALHPRTKGWKATPSAEAVAAAKQNRIFEFYDVTNKIEMVSCLLVGWPVVWGANGHALCKVEHLNDKEGLDANSWAADWGDQGFGVWASYANTNWGYGAWAVRTTNAAPQLPKPE